MSVTKTIVGGMATGAVVGYGTGGPLGALGGAFGGAILGAAADWWGGPPQPQIPDAPSPPEAPNGGGANLGPITPTALDNARLNLRQTIPQAPPPPPPMVVPPPMPPMLLTPAVLTSARANLNAPPPAPLRIWLPNPADAIFAARRNALRNVQVPIAPRVVSLAEQRWGMRLEEFILPPPFTSGGAVYFLYKDKLKKPDSVPPFGAHVVKYFYRDALSNVGPSYTTTLHIKPTVAEMMRTLGFVAGNDRWQLNVGQRNIKGTPHTFHLSVPTNGQTMPVRMDSMQAIFNGIYPMGVGMTGTHMSVEVRQGVRMNNAAYFLNGSPKSAQGFSPSENTEFTNACRKALDDWKAGAIAAIRNTMT